MILHTKFRERLLYQEGKRYVLVLAKPEADLSLGVWARESGQRDRRCPSKPGLQYGLQYMASGGIPAFALSSTFYLQISTF